MPLYEYHCDQCDATVEVLQRRADEVPQCPSCEGTQLERLLSVPAAPAVRDGASALPIRSSGESCGAPRCCGGGCGTMG
ncbi:FmdB family zinc ribbon protein [Candidatus Laterigemmans baculatus]|uniref:FmdB family zinc ribbon protein n=1 Tax=Candidatus Laterigemmans baculatus TaxID=2770505 RepID=UPI0013DB5186|nr:zinc ribbon domain-containing protein [Candidatus Laterigemmans baculatus]